MLNGFIIGLALKITSLYGEEQGAKEADDAQEIILYEIAYLP